jgi:hypothetical protein
MFSRFFGANPTVANQNDFNTPDKRSNYTDILRGSGPEERPFSKQVGMSHAQDFFQIDIPDPTHIKS